MVTSTLNLIEAGLVALASLDLTKVKRKLCEPTSKGGQGWTRAQADKAETWYRRFLEMRIRDGASKGRVPNRAVDVFWHQHILDTRAYVADCQALFGEFFHHNPYGSERGLADPFRDTNARFQELFREDPQGMTRLFGQELARASTCKGPGEFSGPSTCENPGYAFASPATCENPEFGSRDPLI